MNNKAQKYREQKQNYRKTHTTYCLSFENKQAHILDQRAHEKGMSVPTYLKALLEVDHKRLGYILPDDTKCVELSLALRRIGNNINQLVRFCNTGGSVKYSDIEALQKHLSSLEESIVKAFSDPPALEVLLAGHIEKHPDIKEKLKDFLIKL